MDWSRLSGRVALVAAVVFVPVVVDAAAAHALSSRPHEMARSLQMLRAFGIRLWSSGHCTDRRNPHCTSVAGMRPATLAGIITLRQASRCRITITGGTEAGHAPGRRSHRNGYKVDLAANRCLGRYIRRHFPRIGRRRDGAHLYRSAAGNVYAREATHWDVFYR